MDQMDDDGAWYSSNVAKISNLNVDAKLSFGNVKQNVEVRRQSDYCEQALCRFAEFDQAVQRTQRGQRCRTNCYLRQK